MAAHEPREWLERPDWFGKNADAGLIPIPDTLALRGERAAAYHQHLAAYQVRRILDQQRTPVATFAQQLGITPETLRRKLRGETTATYADLLTWALACGIEVLPEPNNTTDLEP